MANSSYSHRLRIGNAGPIKVCRARPMDASANLAPGSKNTMRGSSNSRTRGLRLTWHIKRRGSGTRYKYIAQAARIGRLGFFIGTQKEQEIRMHTFTFGETFFQYNSDLSGDVQIAKRNGHETLDVPGEALIAFIAYYVRNQRIREIEDMDDAEVLGLLGCKES